MELEGLADLRGHLYVIWTMLYTSVFGFFVQPHGYCSSEIGNTFGFMCSKFGGVFTGSWQSLGYWLAQQDVARGTQPWYYHFLLGGVYEFLPMIFGLIAIVYYLRKGDLFGLFLGFWAILTFAAYVKAGEKMPWLIVNLTLPFIILAGKFIGEIIERLRWRRVLRGPPLTLFILAPLLVVAGITLLYRFMDRGSIDSWQGWGLLAVIITIAVVSVFLIKLARPGVGLSLASLGVATLMLGFSTFVAFRASYTYDDSPIEMLVYAQGSADIVDVADTLDARVIGQGANGQVVDVDRELWYPFNWYVRDEQKEGSLGFRCYKNDKEAGYATYCKPLEEPPSTDAVLLVESHANRDSKYLGKYEKAGPFKNLLWFPETYRRPGEKRKNEGFTEQIKKDYEFIKDTVASRESWKDALDYFLFRKVESQWWDSKFFSYIATDPAS